jgi:hypothetical protein
MSSVASVTGGGDDDPSTISQFSFQRKFGGAGSGAVSSVSSNSAEIIVSPTTGDVKLTYAGPEQVTSGGPGISVSGNQIFNTGVTSVNVAGSGLTINQPTGDVVITATGSGGGGGGGSASAESFCMALAANYSTSTYAEPVHPYPWTTTGGGGAFGALIPGEALFNNLTVGSVDLETGIFTCGVSGTYQVGLKITTATFNTNPPTFFIVDLDATNPRSVLTSALSPYMQMASIYLVAGHHYQLETYNEEEGLTLTIPYVFNVNGGFAWPNLMLSFSLAGGGNGTAAASPESFSVALSADAAIPQTDPRTWATVTPFTHTVDTGSFPAVSPSMLYNNLTLGSLDLPTGTFTCGVTGNYQVNLCVADYSELSPNAVWSFYDLTEDLVLHTSQDAFTTPRNLFLSKIARLQAGHQYCIRVAMPSGTGDPTNLPHQITTNDLFTTYNVQVSAGLIHNPGSSSSGSSSPEAFSICLSEDYPFGSGVAPLTGPWIDAPDTVIFPEQDPGTVFSNLTLGSLNLSTGTFTCGVSGAYQLNIWLDQWTGGTATELTLLLYDLNTTVPIYIVTRNYNFRAAIVDLVAGHQYQWSTSSDGTGTINFNSVVVNWPSFFWSMALFGGAGGGGSGENGESFALAMVNAITLTTPDEPVVIAPLTDTVDTGAFFGLSPKMLHDHLVAPNAVDLSTGVFTCGTAGQYLFQFPTSYVKGDGTAYFALQVNGDLVASDGNLLVYTGNASEGTLQGSAILDLLAGDQVQLICSSGDPSQFIGGIINNTNTAGQTLSGPNTTYSVVWKCVRIMGGGSGGGGGGGGGTVMSVTGGTGINVNNTDPTNPVVSNAGVLSVAVGAGLSASASTGAITLTNTGVRQLQAGTGISLSSATGNVTISATGGGGGGGGGAQTLQLMTPSGVPTASGLSGNISGNFLNLSNTGILQMTAGPGISLSGNQLNKTITATGGYRRIGFFQPITATYSYSTSTVPYVLNNWATSTTTTAGWWATRELALAGFQGGQVVIPIEGLWRITAQLVATDDSGARLAVCQGAGLTPLLTGQNSSDANRQVSQLNCTIYFDQGEIVSITNTQPGSFTIYKTFGALNLTGTYWGMEWIGPTSYNP